MNASPRLSLPVASRPAVYVIHENAEWLPPLREALEAAAVPWVDWFVHEGRLPLDEAPPLGVFYNRMSASSHTRGHRHSVDLTAQLLAWLQRHGRRVVNGRRALQLEVSKFEQYLALDTHGIRTPRTLAASGAAELLAAARALDTEPFIVKPNRGGKGLGVQRFNSVAELERQVAAGWEAGLDGIDLVQEYIPPAAGHITRMEFIAGRYFYQVEVDASGGFELCPAGQLRGRRGILPRARRTAEEPLPDIPAGTRPPARRAPRALLPRQRRRDRGGRVRRECAR
jgi:hypothetical protein